MILLAMIMYLLYLYLASYYSGSFTSSFTNLSRSFSCRMSMILYFHALKFSTPSRFSSSLVFFFIFNRLRTSNGLKRNNTYLKKTKRDWPPSRWPRFWCRSPNFLVGIIGRVEWWRRCTSLGLAILFLDFFEINDGFSGKMKP